MQNHPKSMAIQLHVVLQLQFLDSSDGFHAFVRRPKLPPRPPGGFPGHGPAAGQMRASPTDPKTGMMMDDVFLLNRT